MLELFLKSTLLLGLGLGVSGCLPKNRPTQRHLILLASLLALPLLCVVGALPPILSVTVPQAAPERIAAAPYALQTPPPPTQATIGQPETLPSLPEQAPVVFQAAPRTIPLAALLGALYALGVVSLLLRFLQDQRALRQLLTKTRPADYPADFPVRLTPEPVIPLACGLRRPCIVLPETATHWERERLAAVLLHESAHLKRHDVLWQGYATLLCALLWPHPLVWWVAKRLAAEAENACDAAVLEAGIAPRHYAGHLLAVAQRTQKSRSLAPSLGQPGKLERRIHTILAFVPARGLPILATVSLIAVALACVPLILVKLHPRPDTSKLTSQEILNRTEQAYATCTTYSDTGTDYDRPLGINGQYRDNLQQTQSFHTEFSRDGYLYAAYIPKSQTTPVQVLQLDQQHALTRHENEGHSWRTQDIALKAYAGHLFIVQQLLKVKGFDLTNRYSGSERLLNENGNLVVKVFWLPADYRKKNPSSQGTYEKFQIDPETFLVRQREFYVDEKLFQKSIYQPQLNSSIQRQPLPDKIEPGFTYTQELQLAQSRAKAAALKKTATILEEIAKKAPQKEQKLRQDIYFAQGQIAYFAQKSAEMEEAIVANQRNTYLPDAEKRVLKFRLVLQEAQHNLARWEARQEKAERELFWLQR